MSIEDQHLELRQTIVNDIKKVLNKHQVEVGASLTSTDIIGLLEWLKMDYYLSIEKDDVLHYTSL